MTRFEEYLQAHPLIKLNDEQKAALMSDSNTVVSAGAGSGKTHVLSYRFLRLVMDGKAHSDEILTLTFTRKAAGEMRERIYQRLIESADIIGRDEVERFQNAQVSTLDSFSARIVRSDSVRYGISRDFVSLDADDPSIGEMVKRLSDAFLKDPENREEARVLSSVYSPDDVLTGFFSYIFENCRLCMEYSAADVSAKLEALIEELLEKNLAVLTSSRSFLEGRLTKSALEIFRSNNDAISRGDYNELAKIPRRMKDQDVKDFLEDAYNPAILIMQDVGDAWAASEESRLLQSAVEKFIALVKKEKRRSGILTFADVSAMAVDILKENKEIRKYYKERFSSVMIDEFQDNNKEQRDLLFLLSEKRGFEGEGIPSALELEEGKLFFVGDEKQSIYRFRGADVSVFRSLQSEIREAGGCNLSLTVNYRSTPFLIGTFNELFEEIFRSASEEYEARFEEAVSGKAEMRSRIELALLNRKDRGTIEDALDSSECEAEYIADKILTMVLSDDYLLENNRRPGYSDIAILLRSGGNQMYFERALKNRGIPYQVTESRSLMAEGVANDFYSLLESIVYPQDRKAFASLLRSPFARLGDEGVKKVMEGRIEELEGEDIIRFRSFFSFYEEVKKRAFRLRLTELLEFIYIEGGYASFLIENPSLESYREHYDYLFAYARSYDTAGLFLTDYLRFLRSSAGSSNRTGEVTVLHEKKEGVQIMTVHKSKGLEFPIVIVADIGNTGRRSVNTNLFKYQGQLIASRSKSICAYIDSERSAMDEAELRRVLYVALTRAKCHLLISGCFSDSNGGGFNKSYTGLALLLLAQAAGFDPGTLTLSKPLFDFSRIPPRNSYTYIGGRVRVDRRELEKRIGAYEEKGFCEKLRRIAVTALEEEAGDDALRLTSFPEDALLEEYNAYDRFGTCTHAILEAEVQGLDSSTYNYSIVADDDVNQALMAYSRAMAASFLQSSLYGKIKERPKECELRFFSYSEEHDCAIEGVCDLVVFFDDYTLVIDYKTDSAKTEGGHRIQILTYIKVLEELYGKPCYGSLFYLREGVEDGFIDNEGNKVEIP